MSVYHDCTVNIGRSWLPGHVSVYGKEVIVIWWSLKSCKMVVSVKADMSHVTPPNRL